MDYIIIHKLMTENVLILCSVTVPLVPDISKECHAFIFKINQSKKKITFDYLTQNMKEPSYIRMSGTTSPMTQGHTSEEPNLQQHRCDMLKS
jgi:hypothetical protein